MTLLEMKKKVLQLIEEIDDSAKLTSDPDIAAKLNSVINQVQFEFARMKKIPASATVEIKANELFDLRTLTDFYQLMTFRLLSEGNPDASYEMFNNTILATDDCTALMLYYKYPAVINDDTADDYEFELSQDALEIMPYGVAADLLKSDVSTNYGAVYSQRYETMLQRLDPRYSLGGITFTGGIDI